MANVDIIPDVTNHHTITTKTDVNGFAYVTAVNGGTNVIECEMVVPYENESDYILITSKNGYTHCSFCRLGITVFIALIPFYQNFLSLKGKGKLYYLFLVKSCGQQLCFILFIFDLF